MVGEKTDVLEELEGHVQRALCQGGGVEDLVLAGLGALHELAEPGVHWEKAEEAEGYAGAGEQGAEGGEAGWYCDARRGDEVGRFALEAAEQGKEAGLQRRRLGLEVGEQVEGVVEGGEEGAQAARGGEELVQAQDDAVGSPRSGYHLARYSLLHLVGDGLLGSCRHVGRSSGGRTGFSSGIGHDN